MTVVDLTVRDGTLEVRVLGFSKLWALKRLIRVPLRRVRSVRHDPEGARGLWMGWRLPGTHVPGIIRAGTYRKGGEKHFWDVRRTERAIVVELEDAAFDRLIVEVREGAVRLIGGALRRAKER